MNVLIIIANPKSKSFSHHIAEAYADGADAAGKKTQILDLYTTDLQLDFLRPETKDEFHEQQPIREALQDQLTKADEIIIIHPLWWGGPPAILKNYIDQVFTPGFAYRHHQRDKKQRHFGSRPERLLKDKSVRLFVTGDSRRLTNLLRGLPWYMTWRHYIFGFTGISLKSVRFYGYMRDRKQLQRSEWLANVRKMGQNS